MNNKLKEYLKDRDKIAISGKYEDYKKFCKKYHITQAPNNEVFEIMIHKVRANITTLPKEIQEESKKWLLENDYKLF